MVLRVRPRTNEEGNHLRTSIRHSHDLIEMKRAQVILASAQGFRVQQILVFSGMSEGYIRILTPLWRSGSIHLGDALGVTVSIRSPE